MINLLQQQLSAAFNAYAHEGSLLLPQQKPVLSHICFKFADMEAYNSYVASARELGTVIQRQFNGTEISWWRLANPLEKDGLRLDWVELVEPNQEKSAFTGVASIGYAVPGLSEVVKIPSADKSLVFRYQSRHAAAMAVVPG